MSFYVKWRIILSKRSNNRKPGRTRRDILESRILSIQELVAFYEQAIKNQTSKIEKYSEELASLNESSKEE